MRGRRGDVRAAAAGANAVWYATRTRVRRFPIRIDDLMAICTRILNQKA
jgi:CO/xanthine dehydrogenase Mo-binding subunit